MGCLACYIYLCIYFLFSSFSCVLIHIGGALQCRQCQCYCASMCLTFAFTEYFYGPGKEFASLTDSKSKYGYYSICVCVASCFENRSCFMIMF